MIAAEPRTSAPWYVSLDLEFNQPSQRIIQLGAVLGDMRTGQRISRLSVFVNPEEPLAPEIANLCGIAPGVLETAGSLEEAHAQLCAWLAPFRESRRVNPLTWGGADSETLRLSLGLPCNEHWLFGRRWLDVKTVFTAFQDARDLPATGGLATSMKKVGLFFEGRKHDAADDAWNTFRMYHRLVSLSRPG